MATTRGQRLGIWIITGTLAIGTIGGFIAMMVQPGNDAKDQAELKRAQEDYKKATTEWQKKVNAQTAELHSKYYGKFSEFSGRVGAFEASGVKELQKEDLVVGEGAEIKDDTKFAVYYIGWNAKGEIFDQSINSGKLKAPFTVDGLANTAVIQGWKEGLLGMKIGGVRELTIPAGKAYGDKGQGDKIPANAPLKFVVMTIEKPAEITRPKMPEIIRRYYRSRGLNV